MLKLNQYNDVEVFKNEVIPFLEKDEIINGLLLGLLLAVKDAQPIFMATLTREESLVLVIFQTSPKQMILSKSEDLTTDEINQFANLLNVSVADLPGFIGERNLIIELSKYITHLRSKIPTVHMNQRIYRLDTVTKKAELNGSLVHLGLKDLPLVKEWLYQFCIDIDEKMSKEQAEEKAFEILERGRIYGWEVDGELVSMANASRPTSSNITVNFVYTPLSERKKGYASSCVSAITELMLESGYKTTSLYTDLDNPTSNKIYMEIGYKPVFDSIVIHFNE
ncbi:GNAT family N-acetyltransferase [Bacillus sp. CGMCC 1.16607]|uniref:GNAT family N-acetyltransferase n=1 Tax=Bacillus sp. CGMCC 1.16607 TaxID=3351842 RepID=UPI003631EB4A